MTLQLTNGPIAGPAQSKALHGFTATAQVLCNLRVAMIARFGKN